MTYTSSLLNDYLSAKKEKNIHYSMRAFARDLNINRNTLSKSLSGTGKLGKSSCLKIKENLNLPDTEYLKLLFDNHIEYHDNAIKEIDSKKFEVINHLKHFSVLSLLQNKRVSWSLKALEDKVDMSPLELRLVLKDLLSLELIEYDGIRYHRIVDSFRTTDNISNQSIKNYHKENLKKAIDAVDEIDLELRDISSISFVTNKENLYQIKEEIKNFRRRLGELAFDKDGEDVYSVAISLHPLTKSQ